MKSFAQALDLKDDPAIIARYKEYHRNVWPEVLAGLRQIGIRNMRIFLLGRHLFMYFEAPDDFDPARDFAQFQSHSRAVEWEQLMRTLQQKVPDAQPSDWWAPMECVFEL